MAGWFEQNIYSVAICEEGISGGQAHNQTFLERFSKSGMVTQMKWAL